MPPAGTSVGSVSSDIFDPGKRADKNRKYLRKQPETHFTEQIVEYSYPDGLIMPLVWGLRALMEVRGNDV